MKKLLRPLITTAPEIAPFIVRLFLGAIILPHGLQKSLGMFGGYGFEGTMGFLTGTAHLPWIVAFLVIVAESLGAIALILGIFVRFCGASYIILMAGAIMTVHLNNGFFMNWTGAQPGEGFEYHLLVIGMALSLVVSGAGRWSVDYAVNKNLK